MGRERLRQAILGAGCGAQMIYLFASPLPGIAALLIPLVSFALAIWFPLGDSPGPSAVFANLVAPLVYLIFLAYCVLQAANGYRPDGSTVFLFLMLPAAAMFLGLFQRALSLRAQTERYIR